MDSSANPAVYFQKASDATENYYLIYYAPKDFRADGKFKEIKVKIKGKSYKVTHDERYLFNTKDLLKFSMSSSDEIEPRRMRKKTYSYEDYKFFIVETEVKY